MQPYYIAMYSTCYLSFFTLLLLSSKHQGNRLVTDQPINKPVLLLLHIGGIIFLGGFCLYVFHQPLSSIITGIRPASFGQVFVTCLLIAVAILLGFSTAQRKYSTCKTAASGHLFSSAFIALYFLLRISFLAIYETWFRGCLLTDCIESVGVTAAIVVNIFLYSLLHVVNGRQEVKACIPLGLLFCSLCAWTGSAWPAILIHIAMTVSYEGCLVNKINNASISII